MKDLRIYNLIHKRLTGQLESAELKELESFENSKDYSHIISDIENIWAGSKDYFPQKTFDVESAKTKFKNKLSAEKSAIVDAPTSQASEINTRSESSTPKWLKPLAVIGLLALLSLLGYYLINSSGSEMQRIESKQEIEYALLPDKSEIYLKNASTLDVAHFEGANKRNVKLSGEAFFKIAPDANKPFNIDLGNGNKVEVLGTMFNVISDLGDGTSKVDVKEGSVKLYSDLDPALSVIITAGESSILNSKTKENGKTRTNRIYSLIGNSLSFKDTPLDVVFEEIGNEYKVKFDVKRDVTDITCKFTSPLLDNSKLPQIIDLLNEYYPNLNISSISPKEYSVKGSCR
jgi:transmembrane sensor